jgi:hypothetical protein
MFLQVKAECQNASVPGKLYGCMLIDVEKACKALEDLHRLASQVDDSGEEIVELRLDVRVPGLRFARLKEEQHMGVLTLGAPPDLDWINLDEDAGVGHGYVEAAVDRFGPTFLVSDQDGDVWESLPVLPWSDLEALRKVSFWQRINPEGGIEMLVNREEAIADLKEFPWAKELINHPEFRTLELWVGKRHFCVSTMGGEL